MDFLLCTLLFTEALRYLLEVFIRRRITNACNCSSIVDKKENIEHCGETETKDFSIN